jgi:predicted AAA+ superfamily ATPase
MTGYRPRSIGPVVLEALEEMPVVVVTGLRQTGKSTFLQNEDGLKTRLYLSLDDLAQLEAARRDPERFVDVAGPLTVDEVQRCPELLLAIKRAVDRDRRPGRFLLSGSANLSLLGGVSESLAGRAVYLTLYPFTRRELRGARKRATFLRSVFENGAPPRIREVSPVTAHDVVIGGFPPVALGLAKKPEIWFRGYEQTYLERDVRSLSRITDLVSFRQFLRLAALRTGQLLSVSELGRDSKLNVTTTSRYLSLLEASFVVSRVGPFLSNRATRLIKSPKLYVGDSGLAAHLSGSSEPMREPALGGALLETYAAQNIASILESSWPGARLSFWSIQGRHEVDFIVESGSDSLAIEVKSGARVRDRDIAGLQAFLRTEPRCRVALLAYGGSEVVPLGERLWAVPLDRVLS